jgi:RNA polymerase sigma-70 factor (ECF subfamily)
MSHYEEETDVQLHEAWCAGDRRAGHELSKRYFSTLARFVRGKVSDPAAADEIVSTTLLALVRSRDRVRDPAQFRAFVIGIARNVLKDYYRKHGADRLCFLGDEQLDLAIHSLDDLGIRPPDALDFADHEGRSLVRALHLLPIEDQQILMAFYAESMSYAEIAQAFDLPHGTVSRRLHTAKTRLTAAMRTVLDGNDAFSSTSELFDQVARRAQRRIEGLGAVIPRKVGRWHLVKFEPAGVDVIRGRYRRIIRRPVIELELGLGSKRERGGLSQGTRSIGDRSWILRVDGPRKEYALQLAMRNDRELYLAHRPTTTWDDVIHFAGKLAVERLENHEAFSAS